MPLYSLKSTPEREAKRLIRLLMRRKANWSSEPSLRQLNPRQIAALQEYIARWENERFLAKFLTLLCAVFIAFFALVGIGASTLPLIIFAGGLFVHQFDINFTDYRYAVYALTQTDDMRVLPTLIQATRRKGGRHPQVRAAILRLLAQLTEEHIGLLNDAAQHTLWTVGVARQTLAEYADHDIAVRTLRALAAVGNQATLTRMKRFVYLSEHLTDARYVVAVARDLIPIMEARFHREEAPETLLRATHAPASQPETLLRAAHSTTTGPSQQLLRASTSQATEIETNA